MGKMEIVYYLTEEGRRANLLAGGDGNVRQVLDVPEELRERFLALADVDRDGDASLDRPDYTTTVGYEPKLVDRAVDDCPRSWNRCDERGQYRIYSPSGVSADFAYDAPQSAEAVLADVEAYRALDLGAAKAACQVECDRLNADPEVADSKAAAEQWVADYLQQERETEERLERKREEEKRAKAAAQAAFLADAEDWIREHGSERLRAILDEGLLDGSLALYRAERLTAERPGWIYDDNWCGGDVEHRDIRNPSMEALEALGVARAAGIECELRWAHHGDSDDYEYGDQLKYIREPILAAEFLCRTIVLRVTKQDTD